MTTDDFTEAARAEAEKTWPKQRHGVHVNPSLIRDEMVRMAAWARTHLAAQDRTAIRDALTDLADDFDLWETVMPTAEVAQRIRHERDTIYREEKEA